MGCIDPQSMASLYLRGLLDMAIYRIYISHGPHGHREVFFTITSLTGSIDTWGVPNLDPRGFIGRIYVGDN